MVEFLFGDIAGNSEASLYIHIPFCRSKCDYCDFFSKSVKNNFLIKRVIEETMCQTETFLDYGKIAKIPSVYIGGGTPTSVPGDLLSKLLSFIAGLPLEENAEITIEANPENINSDMMSRLADSPVNRLSIGIQSFDGEVLKTLGRRCSRRKNLSALEIVKKKWDRALSIDLIASVPKEKSSCAIDDIKTAISFAPDHISLYALTLEEGTALYKKYFDSQDLIDENVWIEAVSFLESSGYRRYEISNFAKKGYESLHNTRYWKMLPYIGTGPGGVSTLHIKGASLLRISNVKDFDLYLEGAGKMWNAETESIKTKEYIFEYLMMGLRMRKGIYKAAFEKKFKRDIVSLLPETLDRWISLGYVSETARTLRLTDKGLLIMNRFLVEVLEELDRRF